MNATPVIDIPVVIHVFCDLCGQETMHELVQETALTEIYACEICGSTVEYTVR